MIRSALTTKRASREINTVFLNLIDSVAVTAPVDLDYYLSHVHAPKFESYSSIYETKNLNAWKVGNGKGTVKFDWRWRGSGYWDYICSCLGDKISHPDSIDYCLLTPPESFKRVIIRCPYPTINLPHISAQNRAGFFICQSGPTCHQKPPA